MGRFETSLFMNLS